MNKITRKISEILDKININPSFYVVLILVVFFKIYKLFLCAFLFIFLHELSHILMAKKFGLKLKKIVITPIGQVAIIEDMEKLYLYQKLMIVSIGVIFNLVVALFFSLFTDDKMQLIKNINLSIAFFNSLPILPLDGGRFFSYLLGNKIGDLKASIIIKKISIGLSYAMVLLGFVQIILAPYNISLLCLSIYFIKINKTIYILDFYKNISNKQKYDKILKIREILVDKNFYNKDLILRFTGDYYTIINVSFNNKITYKINEIEFLKYIEQNGINGNIGDMGQMISKYEET